MNETGLHYINTVRNETYLDLYLGGCENRLTQYKDDLKKYVCNCDCMRNAIGASFCYFSEKGGTPDPLLFFSKSAKKEKAVSVCVFSQSNIYEWKAVNVNAQFSDMFVHPMFSEEQIDQIAAGQNYSDSNVTVGEEDVYIAPGAVKAVMRRIMQRWLMGEKQITIAVPADCADYNRYVINAARKLYSYFPALMKLEAGFISYLFPEKMRSMQRIYLVFMPEAEAVGEKIYLDGSNADFIERTVRNSTIPEGMCRLIDHIVDINDAERAAFLDELFNKVEKDRNFTSSDYADYGDALTYLNKELTVDSVVDIADFLKKAESEDGRYSYITDRLEAEIDSKLTRGFFNDYVNRNSSGDRVRLVDALNRILPVLEYKKEYLDDAWGRLFDELTRESVSLDEQKQFLIKCGAKIASVFGESRLDQLKNKVDNDTYSSHLGEVKDKRDIIFSGETDCAQLAEKINDYKLELESDSRISGADKADIIEDCYSRLQARIDPVLEGLNSRELKNRARDLQQFRRSLQNRDNDGALKDTIKKIDVLIEEAEKEKKEKDAREREEKINRVKSSVSERIDRVRPASKDDEFILTEPDTPVVQAAQPAESRRAENNKPKAKNRDYKKISRILIAVAAVLAVSLIVSLIFMIPVVKKASKISDNIDVINDNFPTIKTKIETAIEKFDELFGTEPSDSDAVTLKDSLDKINDATKKIDENLRNIKDALGKSNDLDKLNAEPQPAEVTDEQPAEVTDEQPAAEEAPETVPDVASAENAENQAPENREPAAPDLSSVPTPLPAETPAATPAVTPEAAPQEPFAEPLVVTTLEPSAEEPVQ